MSEPGQGGSPGEPTRPSGPRKVAVQLTERTPRWIWAWALSLVVLGFLYAARSVLVPFIIAGVLAYVFSMVVDRIEERLRAPRWSIVALLYVVVLGVLGVGLYFGAEALLQQTGEFVSQGPNIIERGLKQIIGNTSYAVAGQTIDAQYLAVRIGAVISNFVGTGGDAVHLAAQVFERLLDTLLVIVVSFYLLLDGKRLGGYLLTFVPPESRSRTGLVAGRIHATLSAYIRGQLLLIGLMSLVSFLVLQFIFRVPYALPLGILTGFLEILPLIGPAIAAVSAATVALANGGPGVALGVIIAYVILRELEDQVVMPIVVGRVVDLHPVATIFAVLAGGAIAGIVGMLLAVPAAAAVKVLLDFLYPTDPKLALAQARPGLTMARREAEDEGEE